MATNNFLVFDENQSNMQTDAEYAAETQRTSGVAGIAKAVMHNKLFHQLSMMAAAIGEFIKSAGYNASDADLPTLTNAISNAFASKSDLSGLSTFQTAGGTTGAVITLTGVSLTDGAAKTFIAAFTNTATSKTINGKPWYKPGTQISPATVAGKAYTIWYSASGDCFFIKASAEGTATADKVLAPYTISNDTDTGIEGTMPNNGAVNQALAINGTYTVPAGYHNGSGKVTQSIPTKAAATITPGTTDQVISAGQYLSGNQTVLGDPDLIAPNILDTANIFGIQGTAIAGSRVASSTAANSAGAISFTGSDGKGSSTMYYITVTGLPFTPSKVIMYMNQSGNTNSGIPYGVCYYNANAGKYVVELSMMANPNGGVVSTWSFDVTGNAYLISGGFQLPIPNGVPYTWIAIE